MADESKLPLWGKVAVVAGATRGARRGPWHRRRPREAGATVVCTGRSTRAARSDDDRPETITPGWLRSEMMLEAFGVSESNWRDALGDRPGRFTAPADFALSESPRYVGRAVAAVAADPERQRHNQRSLSSGQLAAEYGFTDVDGSRPDIWRYMEQSERGNAGPRDSYR